MQLLMCSCLSCLFICQPLVGRPRYMVIEDQGYGAMAGSVLICAGQKLAYLRKELILQISGLIDSLVASRCSPG
jgi:hypothetical protein